MKIITTKYFIKRAIEIHGDLYDYSKVEYTKTKTKVCIIDKKYGEFWQSPCKHLAGQNHPLRSRDKNAKRRTSCKEEFIPKAILIHGDRYDYSKVNYINSETKVCIIDDNGCEFWMSPNKHLSGQGNKRRDYTFSKDEFLAKAHSIHGNLYDYSKVEFIDMITKVCIIDPIFGEFWQTPSSHISGHGSKKRATFYTSGGQTSNKEEFIKKCKLIHGDLYNYSKVVYTRCKDKVIVIDPDYGEFSITPSNHLLGKGHPRRSGQISRSALSWLLSLPNSENFIDPHQEPTVEICGKKRKVDGYDKSTNTIYQFHGSYWHGWRGKEIIDQDRYNNTLKKDQEIIDSGYNLVIMWEHDWSPSKLDLSRIPPSSTLTDNFIQKAIKIHGNKYDYSKVVYINTKEKVLIIDPILGEFWQSPTHHLQGAGLKIRTTEQFIAKSKFLFEDRFDYSDTVYINTKTPLTLFDKKLNKIVYISPTSHYQKASKEKRNSLSNVQTLT